MSAQARTFSVPERRPFKDMDELITWVRTHDWVYYHAPMDLGPVRVQLIEVTITYVDLNKSRAILWLHGMKQFRVKLVEHFDRFRYIELGQPGTGSI